VNVILLWLGVTSLSHLAQSGHEALLSINEDSDFAGEEIASAAILVSSDALYADCLLGPKQPRCLSSSFSSYLGLAMLEIGC
jgi:hypothetical protein